MPAMADMYFDLALLASVRTSAWNWRFELEIRIDLQECCSCRCILFSLRRLPPRLMSDQDQDGQMHGCIAIVIRSMRSKHIVDNEISRYPIHNLV